MRRFLRLAIVLGAIVIFSGPGTRALAQGPGQAPTASRNSDSALKQAADLVAAGRSEDAIKAYKKAADDNLGNPEIASEALYRAGAYAGSPAYRNPPGDAKEGLKAALDVWGRLRRDYSGIPAGRPYTGAGHKIREPQDDAPCGLYVKLLERACEADLIPFQDVENEYNTLVAENQKGNKDLAARALFQLGLYAQNSRQGTAQDKATRLDQALKAWEQLEKEYPGSPAGHMLLDPQTGMPDGRLGQLKAQIDRRNSRDWKYQIVDSLVRVTGRNPNYSYALALILIAVLVKLITWPLTIKQYGSMREMQKIQPLVKDLQKKFKGAELNQKTMALYKEHGVNPFAGCLPSLLQLPFLIWIYSTIREYQFAFTHGKFLWIGSPLAKEYPNIVAANLASPDMVLLVIYTISNYVAMKMTPASDPQQQQQQNTMAIMSSAIFFWMFIQWRFPSAFLLYWLALNLLNIWQQYEYIYKPNKAAKLSGGTGGGGATLTVENPDKNGSGRANTERKPIAPANPPARVRPRKKKK